MPKLAIAAAAAAAGVLAYHAYSPTSQLYGRTITRCANPRDLALTYDDGPNDVHTERLLDILARHEAKATFFLIGKFAVARPHIARAIAAAGHLIANHTYTHPNLALLSSTRLRQEFADCSHAIADATGTQPRFFRPPFGARRPAVLQIARELGLQPVMWDVTCFDWRVTATADSIEGRARKVIDADHERGHIILLHDGSHIDLGGHRAHTIDATERILSRYRMEYHFRRVDEIWAADVATASNLCIKSCE